MYHYDESKYDERFCSGKKLRRLTRYGFDGLKYLTPPRTNFHDLFKIRLIASLFQTDFLKKYFKTSSFLFFSFIFSCHRIFWFSIDKYPYHFFWSVKIDLYFGEYELSLNRRSKCDCSLLGATVAISRCDFLFVSLLNRRIIYAHQSKSDIFCELLCVIWNNGFAHLLVTLKSFILMHIFHALFKDTVPYMYINSVCGYKMAKVWFNSNNVDVPSSLYYYSMRWKMNILYDYDYIIAYTMYNLYINSLNHAIII